MMWVPISQVWKEMDTRDAKEEGRIEGKIESKMEAAGNLLENGVSMDIVVESTGLDREDIIALVEELRRKSPERWVPISQVREEIDIGYAKREVAEMLLEKGYRRDLIIKNFGLDEEDLPMRGWRDEEIEGKIEAMMEVAKNLLKKGMPMDSIAEITGLDREDILALG